MSYIVTATRGITAMTSSNVTRLQAIEWIRKRRAVGADHFIVTNERLRQRVGEADLAGLARFQ